MPELPDVEVFRRYLDATGLHQPIDRVAVDEARVVAHATPEELAAFLRGNPFERTYRRGKHLFAALDGGWLELHFGMTGYLAYYADPADAPEYGHVRFRFTNGHELAFVDRRKLGHVAPVSDLEAYLADLAPGATSLLALAGYPVSRVRLLDRLLAAAERRYDALRAGEEDPFEAWRDALAWLGDPVDVQTPTGVVRGVAEDVDVYGRLQVRLPDGRRHTFSAGDVSLRRTRDEEPPDPDAPQPSRA